jgi:hypothetical protein
MQLQQSQNPQERQSIDIQIKRLEIQQLQVEETMMNIHLQNPEYQQYKQEILNHINILKERQANLQRSINAIR